MSEGKKISALFTASYLVAVAAMVAATIAADKNKYFPTMVFAVFVGKLAANIAFAVIAYFVDIDDEREKESLAPEQQDSLKEIMDYINGLDKHDR